MNLFKRLVVTTSVAVLVISVSAVAFSESSFARGTSSPVTPRASTNTFSAPIISSTAVTGCAKTNSVGHNPIKTGFPDPKVAQVDRTFTLNTNCGPIVFKAYGKKAPITVIAMTYLAKSGFFDHSLCHRLTTSKIFVLQCGDPTATGSGGPLFSYRDENLPSDDPEDYPAGTIAMANSGKNTNSSQFFIVYKDTYLPPSYTIWGEVTKGLDIVKKVAAAGVVGGGNDGTPKQTIAIDSVTVKSAG